MAVMVKFNTVILKFGRKGEKTGWTYIEIPADIAQKLKRGNKQSFRVKGMLDDWKFQGIALLPSGGGSFIMPLNKEIRKSIGKKDGAVLNVHLEEDLAERVLNADLMNCLNDDDVALKYFFSLPKSHQHYFSKWIENAKTDETKASRIAKAMNALSKNMGYAEMLRAEKKKMNG